MADSCLSTTKFDGHYVQPPAEFVPRTNGVAKVPVVVESPRVEVDGLSCQLEPDHDGGHLDETTVPGVRAEWLTDDKYATSYRTILGGTK